VLDRIEVDVVEIDGEELAAARDEVTAIARHGGCRQVMGFARAQPILPLEYPQWVKTGLPVRGSYVSFRRERTWSVPVGQATPFPLVSPNPISHATSESSTTALPRVSCTVRRRP
jgi:hypothetical protein